ncbi:hypothetical protein PtA15_11A633 [Puccinia triticina]|uniref:Uncharacterized protein n=1 Tax=Puccinia triticina TaxID=208348 RepID=A0ABY7CXK3_9BASI|nr:uncharacterized protein PtA15_11A633 [Puccinia triticina]WAQ89941.1 hypothetical protein PtA15_11A633 [Puccinia triticina]
MQREAPRMPRAARAAKPDRSGEEKPEPPRALPSSVLRLPAQQRRVVKMGCPAIQARYAILCNQH